MVEWSLRVSRRGALAGLAALTFAGLNLARPGKAQDESPITVATPSASSIRPNRGGEVPSTGVRRPGPFDLGQLPARREPVAPVGLTIEKAGVDAGIEALRVIDGAMQDPTGPWVVAWYENLGTLGVPGNVVMAGHIDYWNVGPSVFYNLASVHEGDEVVVAGDDGKLYPFTVEWVRQYDSDDIPLDDVAGPTEAQSLTLITCGGAFDYATAHYLQRTVVRAQRSGPGEPAPA